MYLVYVKSNVNIIWGYSSAGRVSDWQSEGHGFEPRYLHHIFYTTIFAKNLLIRLYNNKIVTILTPLSLEKKYVFMV